MIIQYAKKVNNKNILKLEQKSIDISLILEYYKTKLRNQAPNERKESNMKNYKITDKATKTIIGVVAMTPDQARRAEKDFIVKEA